MTMRGRGESGLELRMLMEIGAGLTDEQLLAAYVKMRDETALAALVRRHGPMVWGVCRRMLRNHHDMEDAFQATFLVFVRKASSIRSPALLANWLYGVAHQTSLKARARQARRSFRERQVASMPERSGAEEAIDPDVRGILDQELSGLPEKYRAAIVMCDLESMTRSQAARQLGVPEGTVAARVARGRALLTKRLTRRGLGLSAGSVAALLAEEAATAAPPHVMALTMRQAAVLLAGEAVSGSLGALTESVVESMFMKMLTRVTILALGTATVGAVAVPGALMVAQQRSQTEAVVRGGAEIALPPARIGPEEWRVARTIAHESPVNVLACSEAWVAAGDERGNLWLCDLDGNARIRRIQGNDQGMYGWATDRLRFMPDGKFLFSIRNNGSELYLIDLEKPSKPAAGTGAASLTFRDLSGDGQTWLETQGRSLLVRPNLYLLENKPEKFEKDYESSAEFETDVVRAVLSPPDGRRLAVLTREETLRIYDRNARKDDKLLAPLQMISMAGKEINTVQFSNDAKRLAVLGANGFARLIDPETGRELVRLEGHQSSILAAAFSPDGNRLATGGVDQVIRVWDTETGALLTTLEGHTDTVRSLTFDPSGELLLSGGEDKQLILWRRAGEKP